MGTGGCDKLGEIALDVISLALGFKFELEVVLVSRGGAWPPA